MRLLRTLPLRRSLIPLLLAGVVVSVAACSGSSDTAAPSKQSNTRSATTPDVGTDTAAGSDEYCARITELGSQEDASAGSDPAVAIEALSKVAAVAPADLQKDFATLSSVVKDLSALDEKDPESFARVMEIVLRPDVQEASGRITADAKERCGVDLQSTDPTSDDTSTTLDGSDTTSAPGDLNLEDIDAVEAASAGATWPDKLSSTTIINDTDVELAADDAALLTADEGLAACTAVRDALVVKNPQVTVTVKSGSTTVAAAPAGGACAPA